MPQCPNCGANVHEQANACGNCGASLVAGQQGGQPPQGQQGGQPPQGQQGGQPPQGQQGGQPPQGQPRQARGPGGGPPQGGGTSRRKLLIYGGGAAVAAIGGFLLLSGPGDGPEGTSEKFINALDAGNQERAQELIHSQSPMSGTMGLMGEGFERADISVEDTALIEETENEATVEVTVSASSEGMTQTDTSTVELRKEDGDWKVWSIA